MSDLSNLLLLVVLGATVGLWLKLSVARERAVREARQQCLLHGLQLLDETVGLRSLRLRRVNGLRRVERCYGFEVSLDGHDREPGRLWMIGDALSSLSLPTIELLPPASDADAVQPLASDKVVALRPRQDNRLH
ncbi:MAG: DUF3301 domain-containing protein [Rhodanobacter sp.]|nr:MAG: DUF3301 domain-containing protein [Rhodanobacter sp.]TAL95280.1 MAG: DUF3301 domain-containing protein [Rhodanobacter sp.]TAM43147.1 MAG: DUF3301 domain-containing protein [Rhodanobacter sp.]TAN26357.1 MAG: DUF3301 domain-containing protein [Rhodanobacter sp.]